jgi:hypothetical protein
MIIVCRVCGKEHSVATGDEDMSAQIYNSMYGCDSGCLYVRFELSCPCGHEFETGDFGEFDNDEEAEEYFQTFLEEYIG